MVFDESPTSHVRRRRNSTAIPPGGVKGMQRGANHIPRRYKSMKTIIKRMDEVCAEHGFSFAEEFVRLAQSFHEGDLVDPDVKLAAMKIYLQAQEYIEPKKRATTITVNNRPAAELTEAELRELAGIIEQDGIGEGTDGPARGSVFPFRLRTADEPVSDAIEASRLPTD